MATLPPEMVRKIIMELEVVDVVNTRLVNSQWRDVADEVNVWKHYFQ